MKVLFLTTAHNSLSQRLLLTLSPTLTISIEYALNTTDQHDLITSIKSYNPDLVICPFLTTKVPAEIYENYMTLIIHPGPPGDGGPSALDWLLVGDDGSEEDSVKMLEKLNSEEDTVMKGCTSGRKFWGVSIIQATETFDAGPVWAFEQFPINIDSPNLTKSSLYRDAVTRAAIDATLRAISRLMDAQKTHLDHNKRGATKIDTSLVPKKEYSTQCVGAYKPFLGGATHNRPLLKASDREIDVTRHTAKQISRRIRSGDSQPGIQSRIFGPALYVYGGRIDDLIGLQGARPEFEDTKAGDIIATRGEAVCIKTADLKGVWITHIRRLKKKGENTVLWPKVTATFVLTELGILNAQQVKNLDWPIPRAHSGEKWRLSEFRTFQEVWVERDETNGIAYVYFEFYNGAMSTRQCKLLLSALRDQVNQDSTHVIVLMGGSYFSNGIALNIIEASSNPSEESWENINAIDDVVQYLLEVSLNTTRRILTVAAVRGNAAAGGVALMASCDYVLCGCDVVLNPAYRTIGLYGSEFHTISYAGRCGVEEARRLLRDMLPIIPYTSAGLVDVVIEMSSHANIQREIKKYITEVAIPSTSTSTPDQDGKTNTIPLAKWKVKANITPEKIRQAREAELKEMTKDFWGKRSKRYHERRFDFVRKVKPDKTPLRFAWHRRVPGLVDEEEGEWWDDDGWWEMGGEEESENRDEESKLRGNGKGISGERQVELIGRWMQKMVVGNGSQKDKESLYGCYYNA